MPIFKFLDHTWGNLMRPPRAEEIVVEINDLWADLKSEDGAISCGGITVETEDEQPMISYSKTISFLYAAGESYSY